MPNNNLVQVSSEDWQDIYLASQFSNALATFRTMDETLSMLENDTGYKMNTAVPFDTGLFVGRKAVLFRAGSKVVLAFEATKPNEVHVNTWSHAWNPGRFWVPPLPRYWQDRQVQSFYLEIWLGMKDEVLREVVKTIGQAEQEGVEIDRLIITGHSMGGGLSVLALIDVVAHLRDTFGSPSSSPHSRCTDQNLKHLIRHITFAEYPATGYDHNAHLNLFYERYGIPGWDLVHPNDITTGLHLPFFRSWRGHRYVLPRASVDPFERDFGGGRHDMPGYLKAARWLKENPREVRSGYDYP